MMMMMMMMTTTTTTTTMIHSDDNCCQSLEPESLLTNPIIFGDFIKVGAARDDRVYEELSNIDKVKNSLGDVRFVWIFSKFPHDLAVTLGN